MPLNSSAAPATLQSCPACQRGLVHAGMPICSFCKTALRADPTPLDASLGTSATYGMLAEPSAAAEPADQSAPGDGKRPTGRAGKPSRSGAGDDSDAAEFALDPDEVVDIATGIIDIVGDIDFGSLF